MAKFDLPDPVSAAPPLPPREPEALPVSAQFPLPNPRPQPPAVPLGTYYDRSQHPVDHDIVDPTSDLGRAAKAESKVESAWDDYRRDSLAWNARDAVMRQRERAYLAETRQKAERDRINLERRKIAEQQGLETFSQDGDIHYVTDPETGKPRYKVGASGYRTISEGRDDQGWYEMRHDQRGPEFAERVDLTEYVADPERPGHIVRRKQGEKDATKWETAGTFRDFLRDPDRNRRLAAEQARDKAHYEIKKAAEDRLKGNAARAKLALSDAEQAAATRQERLAQIDTLLASDSPLAQRAKESIIDKVTGIFGEMPDDMAAAQREIGQLQQERERLLAESDADYSAIEQAKQEASAASEAATLFGQLADAEGIEGALEIARERDNLKLAAQAGAEAMQRLGLVDMPDAQREATREEMERIAAGPDAGAAALAREHMAIEDAAAAMSPDASEADRQALQARADAWKSQAQEFDAKAQQQQEAEKAAKRQRFLDSVPKIVAAARLRRQDSNAITAPTLRDDLPVGVQQLANFGASMIGAFAPGKKEAKEAIEKIAKERRMTMKQATDAYRQQLRTDAVRDGIFKTVEEADDWISNSDARHGGIFISPITGQPEVGTAAFESPEARASLLANIENGDYKRMGVPPEAAQGIREAFDRYDAAAREATIQMALKTPDYRDFRKKFDGKGMTEDEIFAEYEKDFGWTDKLLAEVTGIGAGAVQMVTSTLAGVKMKAGDLLGGISEDEAAKIIETLVGNGIPPSGDVRSKGMIGQTIGQYGPQLVLGALMAYMVGATRGKGKLATAAASALSIGAQGLMFGMQIAADAYVDVFQQSAIRDPETGEVLNFDETHKLAMQAFDRNIALGFTEIVPVGKIFSKIPPKKLPLLLRAIAAGGTESAQEVFQQEMTGAINNAVAGTKQQRMGLDEVRDIFLGSALVAGGGLGIRATAQNREVSRAKARYAQQEAQIAATAALADSYKGSGSMGEMPAPMVQRLTKQGADQIADAKARMESAEYREDRAEAAAQLNTAIDAYDALRGHIEADAKMASAGAEVDAYAPQGVPQAQIDHVKHVARAVAKVAMDRADMMTAAEKHALETVYNRETGNFDKVTIPRVEPDATGKPVIEESTRRWLTQNFPAMAKLFPKSESEVRRDNVEQQRQEEAAKAAAEQAKPAEKKPAAKQDKATARERLIDILTGDAQTDQADAETIADAFLENHDLGYDMADRQQWIANTRAPFADWLRSQGGASTASGLVNSQAANASVASKLREIKKDYELRTKENNFDKGSAETYAKKLKAKIEGVKNALATGDKQDLQKAIAAAKRELPPAKKLRNPSGRVIKVKHGSPHVITGGAFDNAAIGTGEGQQVYGYGFYVASRGSVASHYAVRRKTADKDFSDFDVGIPGVSASPGHVSKNYSFLEDDPWFTYKDRFYPLGNGFTDMGAMVLEQDEHGGTTLHPDYVEYAEKRYKKEYGVDVAYESTPGMVGWWTDEMDKLDKDESEILYGYYYDWRAEATEHIKVLNGIAHAVSKAAREYRQLEMGVHVDVPGVVYDLEIDIADSEFLKFDSKDHGIPDSVVKFAWEGAENDRDKYPKYDDASLPYAYLDKKDAADGGMILLLLQNKLGPEGARDYLLENGVRGVKYVDGITRGKHLRPTYNYVIFDPSDIRITDINLKGESNPKQTNATDATSQPSPEPGPEPQARAGADVEAKPAPEPEAAAQAQEATDEVAADATRQMVDRAVRSQKSRLDAMGVEIEVTEDALADDAPAQYEPQTNRVRVSIPGMAEFWSKRPANQAQRDVDAVIAEEAWHAIAVNAGIKDAEIASAYVEFDKANPDVAAAIGNAYSGWDQMTDRNRGHELLRMMLSFHAEGRTTEMAWADSRQLRKALRALTAQNIELRPTPKWRAILQKLIDFLTGAKFDGADQMRALARRALEFDARLATSTREEIDAAGAEAATSPENNRPEPTAAQKEAGNYKKAKVKVFGMDVTIENPKGSTRTGKARGGKEWSVEMKHDYGYFNRTEGVDGDQIDVFIGPNPDSQFVFVVDQVKPTKARHFDEHKVMVGFDSAKEAMEGYLANYSPGWKGLGAMTQMERNEFLNWVKNGDPTKPVAKSVKVSPREKMKQDVAAGAKKEKRQKAAQSKQAAPKAPIRIKYAPAGFEDTLDKMAVDGMPVGKIKLPPKNPDGSVNYDKDANYNGVPEAIRGRNGGIYRNIVFGKFGRSPDVVAQELGFDSPDRMWEQIGEDIDRRRNKAKSERAGEPQTYDEWAEMYGPDIVADRYGDNAMDPIRASVPRISVLERKFRDGSISQPELQELERLRDRAGQMGFDFGDARGDLAAMEAEKKKAADRAEIERRASKRLKAADIEPDMFAGEEGMLFASRPLIPHGVATEDARFFVGMRDPEIQFNFSGSPQDSVAMHNAKVEVLQILARNDALTTLVTENLPYFDYAMDALAETGDMRYLDEIADAHEDDADRDEFKTSKNLFDWVVAENGTTTNWRETGYLLPDGRQVRLTYSPNTRDKDHREVYWPGGPGGTKALISMMNAGAVRIMGGASMGGMSIRRPLTGAQESKIRDYVNRSGEIVADMEAPAEDGFRESASKSFEGDDSQIDDFIDAVSAFYKKHKIPAPDARFTSDGNINASRPLVEPGFYSALAEAVDQKLPARSTPDQAKAAVRKAPGVKPEELKWVGYDGIVDRLAAENGGKVPADALAAAVREQAGAMFNVVDSRGNQEVGNQYANYQLRGGKNYREVVLAMPDKPRENFKTLHFSNVPNYVAHMRLNERADADGEPGLFIEEIQSDRHQKARKEGYREDNVLVFQQLISERDATRDAAKQREIQTKIDDMGRGDIGVNDAPYRKDWPLAMFKRALRDAVESGKAWVGWTDGETQNDRYNLSNQVDEVKAFRRDDGSFDFMVRLKRDGRQQDINSVAPSKLAETIGKELAEKVAAQPSGWQTYSGVDLKVGGKGMRGFYDGMLPKEVAKYVKQWGGKVVKSRINIPPIMVIEVKAKRSDERDGAYTLSLKTGRTKNDKTYVLLNINQEKLSGIVGADLSDRITNQQGRDWYTYSDADFPIPEGLQGPTIPEDLQDQRQLAVRPIWRVEITPEMRAGVSEGQAIFASKPSQSSMAVRATMDLAKFNPEGLFGTTLGEAEKAMVRIVTSDWKITEPHVVRVVPLEALTPIQFGDDYINPSSRETARLIREGKAIDRRWQDVMPVLANADGTIKDGHHRHAAAAMNDDDFIAAVVPENSDLAKYPPLFASKPQAFASQREADAAAKEAGYRVTGVYHFTDAPDFETWDFAESPIAYFASGKNAEAYASEFGSRPIRAALKADKPLDLRGMRLREITPDQFTAAMAAEGVTFSKGTADALGRAFAPSQRYAPWLFVRRLSTDGNIVGDIRRAGFDSIRQMEDNPRPRGNQIASVWGVFAPEQIKSSALDTGVPASERFDAASDSMLRASKPVMPEQDAEYMAAVERGDMDAAQRMVDEAARAAGYRRVVEDSYEDGDELEPRNEVYEGRESHVEKMAAEFAEAGEFLGRPLLLVPNQLLTGSHRYAAAQKSGMLIPVVKLEGQAFEDLDDWFRGTDSPTWGIDAYHWINQREDDQLIDLKNARNEGVEGLDDAIALLEAEVMSNSGAREFDDFNGGIFTDEQRIKSADPVTRDESGNVIPLSERFNPDSDSILYASKPGDPGILNRGATAAVRAVADAAKGASDAAGITRVAKAFIGTGTGQAIKGTAEKIASQLAPWWTLPREFTAMLSEQKSKQNFEKNKFLEMSRVLRGKGEAEMSGIHIPPELATQQNREAMGRVLDGKAPIASLPDALQTTVQKLRDEMDRQARRLLELGMMSPETYEVNRDRGYFPRYYLENERAETPWARMSRKLKMGLGWANPQLTSAFFVYRDAKPRESGSVDYGGRKIIIMKPPGQDTFRFGSEQQRDAYFEELVQQEVYDDMRAEGYTVTRDQMASPEMMTGEARGFYRKSMQDQRAKYRKGRPLTEEELEKLKLIYDVAYSVPKRLISMSHDIALAELFNRMAQRQEWFGTAADAANKTHRQIPDVAGFGAIRGKYLQNNIADQVQEMVDMPDMAMALYDEALRMWKAGKTIANPATHGRNVLGNIPFSILAGNNAMDPRNAKYYRAAVKLAIAGPGGLSRKMTQRLVGDAKIPKGVTREELFKIGLLGGDFDSAELRSMVESLDLPPEMPQGAEELPTNLVGRSRRARALAAKGGREAWRKIQTLYRLEDDFYKIAAYLKYRESGMSQEAAVTEIRKWFPFYDQIGNSGTLKFMRRFPFPFLSFLHETVRIMGAAAKEKPVTMAAMMMLPALLTQLSFRALGLNDEDEDEVMKDLRGKDRLFGAQPIASVVLPFADKNGMPMQWDLTATLPWGSMVAKRYEDIGADDNPLEDLAKVALQNPAASLVASIAQNKDTFSGRPIKETGMTGGEKAKAYFDFIARQLLPPITPGVGSADPLEIAFGADRKGRFLQERNKAQEAARKLGGIDTRSAAPDPYRMAYEYAQKIGLPPQGEHFDTTPRSRSVRRLYAAMVAEDYKTMSEELAYLRDEHNLDIRTRADIEGVIRSKNPLYAIPRKSEWRPFLNQLPAISRKVVDGAVSEYEKLLRRAPTMLVRARSEMPPPKPKPRRFSAASLN